MFRRTSTWWHRRSLGRCLCRAGSCSSPVQDDAATISFAVISLVDDDRLSLCSVASIVGPVCLLVFLTLLTLLAFLLESPPLLPFVDFVDLDDFEDLFDLDDLDDLPDLPSFLTAFVLSTSSTGASPAISSWTTPADALSLAFDDDIVADATANERARL